MGAAVKTQTAARWMTMSSSRVRAQTVDVETAAAVAEFDVGQGIADPDVSGRGLVRDDARDLADPHPARAALDGGGPGDVLRGDVVELNLSRCHVQLAVAEQAVSTHVGPATFRTSLERTGDSIVRVTEPFSSPVTRSSYVMSSRWRATLASSTSTTADRPGERPHSAR